MHNSKPFRQLKVAMLVRNALARIITQGTFLDHYLDGQIISVTSVTMSADLQIANCYLMPSTTITQLNFSEILDRLFKYRAIIRQHLNAQVKLKHSPELRFFMDKGFDNARKINELLK